MDAESRRNLLQITIISPLMAFRVKPGIVVCWERRTRVESSMGPPRYDEVAVSDAAGARARESGAASAGRGAGPDPREPTLRVGVWDRAFWVILSQAWASWRDALAIVEPATVIRWHREGFRSFWRQKSSADAWVAPGWTARS